MIEVYHDTKHRNELIRLWEEVFGYPQARNRPDRVIDMKLREKDQLFWVCLEEGQVCGSIMAGFDGHRGWLYSLAVDPSCRKKGLGTRLVRTAEEELKKRGCIKVNLQILADNHKVEAFYRKMGYNVEPRISMGREL